MQNRETTCAKAEALSKALQAVAVEDDIAIEAALIASRVTPALYSSLAEQIKQNGIGIIAGFLSTPLVAEADHFARELSAANNSEYIAFGANDGLPGYLLGAMDTAPWFHALCQGVYREMTGKVPPPPSFYQVFRCLSGRTGRLNSYYFHYDSYMITVLIPIVIPGGAERGSLILLPNARPVRRSYLVNAIEKALFDRKWAQRLLKWRTMRHPRRLRVDLEPGNLYVFCGYRSLHANEPCSEQELRATLLYHYANPHEDSFLKRAFRVGRIG